MHVGSVTSELDRESQSSDTQHRSKPGPQGALIAAACQFPTGSCGDVAPHQEGGAHPGHPRPRRESAELLECGRTQSAPDGVGGEQGHLPTPGQDSDTTPTLDDSSERGQEEQGHLADVHQGDSGGARHGQRSDGLTHPEVCGKDLCGEQAGRFGRHGLWSSLQQELHGGAEDRPRVCSLGTKDCGRGRDLCPSGPLCQVDRNGKAP